MKKIVQQIAFIYALLFFCGCSSESTSSSALFTKGKGVTDNCGNNYPTILIGGNEWMQKNLDVCKYRNGDPIPQVSDPAKWHNLTTGAWCYYENNTANGTTYGKLYNWYAVNDPRGLAPQGWSVPTYDDWGELINFLGGESVAGGKMKETGTARWNSLNVGATNESAFTAIPAGRMDSAGYKENPKFQEKGNLAVWWSSSEVNDVLAGYLQLFNNTADSNLSFNDENWKSAGFSVRCIRN